MRTADLDYDLPAAAVAQEAIEPRHASRLMIARTLDDRRFSDLPELLHPGDLLVVNRTRVRAARLRGRRADSGGAVELLLLRRLDTQRWEALVRPGRRMRPGIIIDCGPITAEVATAAVDGMVGVALNAEAGDVDDLLPGTGEVPLPPYSHGPLDDPERYQTVFAKTVGSAAAPTAGLHFTPWLIDRLGAGGIEVAEVELEVGLDTFRPVTAETLAEHTIHRERYRVPEATAQRHAATRAAGNRIVAVGTTVVRTLETAAVGEEIVAGEGESDLFITPGYRFDAVDALITNFHAPRTTLIALVAAALGEEWRHVYTAAVERGYRFLSFGDAMLIDPVNSSPGTGPPFTRARQRRRR